MFCEISGRYTLLADVFSEETNFGDGEYETIQDPVTGELTTRLKNGEIGDVITVSCQVNAIIDGGIRVAGTTETFSEEYVSTEYLRMIYPKKYDNIITKRSKVYKIRTKSNIVIWKNNESDGSPTEFDVMGPSPIVDPFGQHIETYTLLKRSGVQHGNIG